MSVIIRHVFAVFKQLNINTIAFWLLKYHLTWFPCNGHVMLTLQTSGMHGASRFCRFAIEKWVLTEESVRKMDLTISFSKDKLCVAFQSLGESRLKHSVFTWQLLTCWKSELVLKRKQVGIKIIAHFQVEPTGSVWFLSELFPLFSEVIVKLDELSSVFL